MVTEKMKIVGNIIASQLFDVSVHKVIDVSMDEWLQKNHDELIGNEDLIRSYINEEIDSVTAIYLAMDRAKEL